MLLNKTRRRLPGKITKAAANANRWTIDHKLSPVVKKRKVNPWQFVFVLLALLDGLAQP
jgi:hypothetical protein